MLLNNIINNFVLLNNFVKKIGLDSKISKSMVFTVNK